MGLLSFFKRKDESPAGDAPAAADAVAQARIRARRRLIGATVLLGIGVIGFPLLFETQPRPIPVDIPIEIPRKESAPPLALPSPRPHAPPSVPAAAVPEPAVAAASAPAAPSEPRATPPITTERASDQGREVPPSAASAARTAVAPASAARTAPAAASAARAAAAPASAAGRSSTEAQRAQALLEGRATPKAASEAGNARLVVQVGAYTDADKLRDARQKVEKLGMKTYTQVVESDGGKRTRVRVGPFATREEADKAAARIKAAGLPVAILTL
jgi:DedD protein